MSENFFSMGTTWNLDSIALQAEFIILQIFLHSFYAEVAKNLNCFYSLTFCSALCGLSICLQQLTYAIKSAALAQTGVFRYMDFCMYVNDNPLPNSKMKKQKFRKLVFYFSG
jgi:hypothetical protein